MNIKPISVFAPATIANVGPGYDTLGVAIMQPGDVVIAERTKERGLMFTVSGVTQDLPTGQENAAAHVAQLMIDELNLPFGVSLCLRKNMPIGSGLGSSGASCVAAVFAINSLLPVPMPKMDLLRFAVEGERLVSGHAHADNVAPSLLGGLCLIRDNKPLEAIKIPIKNTLYWVVVHPHLRVDTADARGILPKKIALSAAVAQWSNIGAMIAAFMLGDNKLLSHSLNDQLIEPIRADLIPGFHEVKQAAMQAGALGCSISGSGPSVFAVTHSLAVATLVANSMKVTFLKVAKMNCDVYISPTNLLGAQVLKENR